MKPADVQQISRTRATLRRLEEEYPNATYDGGRFDEALGEAERSLGRVLVVAKVYLGLDVADEDL